MAASTGDARITYMTSLANALRNSTIAIVSENAYARDLTANAVRQIGSPRILLVRGLSDARDQFAAQPPTVILCDKDVPGSDALAFTRKLRHGELHAPAATPIVLITSNTRLLDVKAARDAGVSEYVMWPYTVGALATRLESSLLAPRPFVETLHYIGPCRRRRSGLGFGGPYRRTTDTEVGAQQRSAPEREAIATRLIAIRRLNRTVNLALAARVRAIHKAAHDMLQLAGRIKDPPVFVACNALVTYIERRGPQRGFDPRLVERHLDGLQALLTLADEPDRIMLADDLAALLGRAAASSLIQS